MRKIVTLVFTLVAASCWAQTSISDNTSYGACIMRDGSVSGINENERFAMHSVMKFPQALYVADYLSRKGLALVPDGSHTIIAVFTKQSPSETVIADIARQLLEQ